MAITKEASNQIKLGAGGSYSLSRDVLKHQMWDTRYFPATPSDNTYFTQPIGAGWSVGTKTKNETNMLEGGKLPNEQTFLINRMGVAFISQYDPGVTTGITTQPNASFIAQAYVNVMQNSIFEIRIAGREYDFQIHGRQFIPALCINGYNAGTAGSVARIGDTVVSGWVKLAPTPIFLGSLVSFSVQQTITNADTTNIMATTKVIYNSFVWLHAYYCTLQLTLEGTLTRAK